MRGYDHYATSKVRWFASTAAKHLKMALPSLLSGISNFDTRTVRTCHGITFSSQLSVNRHRPDPLTLLPLEHRPALLTEGADTFLVILAIEALGQHLVQL